jgi:hypothetical protein
MPGKNHEKIGHKMAALEKDYCRFDICNFIIELSVDKIHDVTKENAKGCDGRTNL